MKLNRTGSNWTGLERNKINENWSIIEGSYNDVVENVSEKAFEQVVDSAKLDWKEPVDSFGDLPSSASEGEARMVRDTGKVYRYNGSAWVEIQQIDAGPVNELDTRLTQQLADADKQRHFESMINRKEPGLMITWIDDDGFVEVYDRMLPLMEDYGIPLASALITSRVGTDDSKYLNIQQVKELQSKGMEFLSHTHAHNPSYRPIEMTEEELVEDFRVSKKFMMDNGLNYHGLVLPFAQTNDLVRKVSKRYFDYVFGGKYRAWNVLYPGKMDNYSLDRVSVEYGFEEVKQRLDEARNHGVGWVVLVSHFYTDWYSDDYARQIIEYAQSSGFEFVSPSEGFNRMGNIAQFDDTNTTLGTTIGADGSIHSDKLARMQYKSYRDIGFDSPITKFEPNTHTITEINSPNATDFPRGLTGDLNTKRYESSDAYSYQEYITVREMQRFLRSWDISNNAWRDFEQTDLMRYLGTNALKADENPLGRDVRYKIVCSHITGNNASDFPEGSNGFYIINSLRTYDSNPTREYHIYRSNRVYKSYWDHTQNRWSEWEVGNTHYIKTKNSYNANTRITDYSFGTTQEVVDSLGFSGDLPSHAGIITTVRLDGTGNAMQYQEFVSYQSADKFMRNATNNGWSRWKKFVWEYAD